tara:strand:+ start:280 stop:660 length:381 start_codon:yes stop_codon:yes gene_type:complete
MTNQPTGPATPNDVVCPYEFTGNANDEWGDLFKSAYKFCVWAQTACVGYFVKGEQQITFEVSDHGDGVADGITIMLHGGWSVGNDLVAYYHEYVLAKLALCCWPDGELTYTNNPGNDNVVFHLWHD